MKKMFLTMTLVIAMLVPALGFTADRDLYIGASYGLVWGDNIKWHGTDPQERSVFGAVAGAEITPWLDGEISVEKFHEIQMSKTNAEVGGAFASLKIHIPKGSIQPYLLGAIGRIETSGDITGASEAWRSGAGVDILLGQRLSMSLGCNYTEGFSDKFNDIQYISAISNLKIHF